MNAGAGLRPNHLICDNPANTLRGPPGTNLPHKTIKPTEIPEKRVSHPTETVTGFLAPNFLSLTTVSP